VSEKLNSSNFAVNNITENTLQTNLEALARIFFIKIPNILVEA
jgi:hypothetical protein